MFLHQILAIIIQQLLATHLLNSILLQRHMMMTRQSFSTIVSFVYAQKGKGKNNARFLLYGVYFDNVYTDTCKLYTSIKLLSTNCLIQDEFKNKL